LTQRAEWCSPNRNRGPNGRTQYHYVLIDFLCRPLAPATCLTDATPGSDVSEVLWITAADLDRLNLRPSIAAVLRKALSTSYSTSPKEKTSVPESTESPRGDR
jgi:hypothetical protein